MQDQDVTVTPQLINGIIPSGLIIPEGKLAIVFTYGLHALSKHIHNLQLMEAGVDLAPIMAAAKARSATKIIQVENDKKSYKKDKIAVVNLSGVMQKDDGWCSNGTASKGAELLELKNDVIGAIFNIDSGGGYMDAAESMISDMREFGKPIVVRTNYAGSAAYMIASEANQILGTSDFAEVGSIGVYFELNSKFREAYKNMVVTAYSRKSQNKNKAFRDWIDADDLSGYVEQATVADEMFMNLVSNNRKLKESKAEETLSGGMFFAEDARQRGLIDGIGDSSKAISLIQKLSRS